MSRTALAPRADTGAAARIARSFAAAEGARTRTEDVVGWLRRRAAAHRFRTRRIPFDELDGWSFAAGTGNLVHRSGRFFTVEGLRVTSSDGPYRTWHQPTIVQPEVGVLGILVKEFDGVLHCLLQAKMEPGNPHLLQLSPTVQATRSNYTGAHGGATVKYVEHFQRPRTGRVLADVLQSEHGSWFYRKSNRNMIVETRDEIPLDEDFCWLTFGQIARLLHRDNTVNMDTRTVLACAPLGRRGGSRPLHSDLEVLSWFTEERARHEVRTERIPLAGLPGWQQGRYAVEETQGRFFRMVALAVEAGNREVTGWTQPLFEPRGLGVTAFLLRRFQGSLHVLVRARVEGGFLDTVELGPTVQCTPGNHRDTPEGERIPFLDAVLSAAPSRVRYEAVHSEEGGRFLNAVSRYLLVEAAEHDVPDEPPPGFAWVTPGQLTSLLRHGHYVNVQARTLIACLDAAKIADGRG